MAPVPDRVYLHHIEPLVPEPVYSQEYAAELMQAWLGDRRAGRLVRGIYRRSGIAQRHSVLPDFLPGAAPRLFRPGPDGRPADPGTAERNRCFIENAGLLAVEAARRALASTPRFGPAAITHLITFSCTGFSNPGVDLAIVAALGLSPAVERYHLGFMGCYAAFPALRLARQACQADPDAVVLIVGVELCTLHLQVRPDPDSLLANALFADGAAAVLVSARPPPAPRPALLVLEEFLSALAPEGGGDMAWAIGDHGFNLVLSSYVPDVIALNIGRIVDDLLARAELRRPDIDLWAVHPGGKAILDKLERALALRPGQLAASRDTLARFGNMSSVTILFVLHQLLNAPGEVPQRIGALAFGPGLTIETGLLELVPAAGAAAAATEQASGATQPAAIVR